MVTFREQGFGPMQAQEFQFFGPGLQTTKTHKSATHLPLSIWLQPSYFWIRFPMKKILRLCIASNDSSNWDCLSQLRYKTNKQTLFFSLSLSLAIVLCKHHRFLAIYTSWLRMADGHTIQSPVICKLRGFSLVRALGIIKQHPKNHW